MISLSVLFTVDQGLDGPPYDIAQYVEQRLDSVSLCTSNVDRNCLRL
jgi:hypothetical protein